MLLSGFAAAGAETSSELRDTANPAPPAAGGSCAHDSSIPADDARCLNSAAPGGKHAYFELLQRRPDLHDAVSLRTPQEVIDNVYFARKNRATTRYDADYDAARFIVGADRGSVVIGDQVRRNFPKVSSGNLLVYWEALAPSYWASGGSVDGVNNYKAFQLSMDGKLALEPRYRFGQVGGRHVARVDVRVYGNQSGVGIGPSDSVKPQRGEFRVAPEKWTHFWAFIDFDNNRFTYWVGDEDRAPVAVIDSVSFDWKKNYGANFGFNQFWFEFNTSQNRRGPEAYHYGRNLIVLRDVSDPQAVVDARADYQ